MLLDNLANLLGLLLTSLWRSSSSSMTSGPTRACVVAEDDVCSRTRTSWLELLASQAEQRFMLVSLTSRANRAEPARYLNELERVELS